MSVETTNCGHTRRDSSRCARVCAVPLHGLAREHRQRSDAHQLCALADDRKKDRFGGGRIWWAHFEFTRINTTPTFLRKKIDEGRDLAAFGDRSSRVSLWKSHAISRDGCLS